MTTNHESTADAPLVGRVACLGLGALLLLAEQFSYGLQRLNMLGYDLDDDGDWHTQQHAPDTPKPTPEQQ